MFWEPEEGVGRTGAQGDLKETKYLVLEIRLGDKRHSFGFVFCYLNIIFITLELGLNKSYIPSNGSG